jgi:mono/diheme cytochrome c family protein
VRVLAIVASFALLIGCEGGERSFEEPVVLGGVEVAPEVLNRGEFAYVRYCRQCHGQTGHGDGPYAGSLTPRPADLTSGEYPRTGATGGELPSDEAIARVIREGIPGTAMGPQGVSASDLEALVQYVKTLAPVWRSPRS